jgi:hypothetical protein
VRLVELLLFELRGIVQILRFIAAAREQQEQAGGKWGGWCLSLLDSLTI